MPPFLSMVIVANLLHLILGWPLLVGVVIVALTVAVPGLIKILSQINNENRFAVFGIAIQVIGANRCSLVLRPMVLFYFFTGHATW
jgi:hypothetical protein